MRIEYALYDKDVKTLSKEKVQANLLLARATHIKAIFGLLTMVNVEEHYHICPTVEPHEDLNRILRGVGELGALITDGMFCEIDELQSICEDVTTFATPDSTALVKH